MREKEPELLYSVNQYRSAITPYYRAGPQQYPRSLSDLLKDPRKLGTQSVIFAYPDPITSKRWGIVEGPDGGIMGVHSVSEDMLLKRAGFRIRGRAFEGVNRYSDWKFVFVPAASQKAAPLPSRQPAAPRQQTPLPAPVAPSSR